MKEKKGISLVAISVSVVVMTILLTTIAVSATSSINNAKKVAFANELYNIQEAANEYYHNNEAPLPVYETITINLSNVGANIDQFEQDSPYIQSNVLVLDKLELDELDITDVQYGKEETNNDVYAISGYTNKVYYVEGLKIGGKKYYTLNDELLKIINKSETETVQNGPIKFTPSQTNWTNTPITVNVKANTGYQVSNIVATNGVVYTTVTTGSEYNVNASGVYSGNYTITVTYAKSGGANKQAIYMVKKFDNVPPTIDAEEITYENKYLKNIIPTDNLSGIKVIKYSEDTIEAEEAKDFFKDNGTVIQNGQFKPGNSKHYTIYVEDRAGNAIVQPVEVDKNVLRKGYATNIANNGTVTGNYVKLNNSIEGNLLNYRIYGNSVQTLAEQGNNLFNSAEALMDYYIDAVTGALEYYARSDCYAIYCYRAK